MSTVRGRGSKRRSRRLVLTSVEQVESRVLLSDAGVELPVDAPAETPVETPVENTDEPGLEVQTGIVDDISTTGMPEIYYTMNGVPSDVGPRVVGLQRFGYHREPRAFAILFSEPMDEERALNLDNYEMKFAGLNGEYDGFASGTVEFVGAEYDAENLAVILYPRYRYPLHKRYELTINGERPDGLTSYEGEYLNGDGHPGTDYLTEFNGKSLYPVDAPVHGHYPPPEAYPTAVRRPVRPQSASVPIPPGWNPRANLLNLRAGRGWRV